MDASEDLRELEGSVDLTNDWESDDLDFSSDFEVDTLQVEERTDNYKSQEPIHANCVDRATFEKEKQAWKEAMEEMSQRFSRATSMLDNMKTIALRDQERIEELEREKSKVWTRSFTNRTRRAPPIDKRSMNWRIGLQSWKINYTDLQTTITKNI